MLKLTETKASNINDLENVHKKIPDEIYQQILKDVTRSRGHIPEDTSDFEVEKFENELTQIICWVLSKHSELNYVLKFYFIYIIECISS